MVEMAIGGKTVSESQYGAFEIGDAVYTEEEFETLREFFENDPGSGSHVTVGEGTHPATFTLSVTTAQYFVLDSEVHDIVVDTEQQWSEFFSRFGEQSFIQYVHDTIRDGYDMTLHEYTVIENKRNSGDVSIEVSGFEWELLNGSGSIIKPLLNDGGITVTHLGTPDDVDGRYELVLEDDR